MKKNKKLSPEEAEALFWKTGFHFAKPEDVPEEVRHVNMRESLVTDEEMGFLVKRIKRIDMLDLHETTITNAGIAHLVKLESLQELRLKSNKEIDNGCMVFLNQIPTLEFLHLRYTNVNVDGLKAIPALVNLKTVLLSDEVNSEETILEKMQSITAALPDCEFWVNGKGFFPKTEWERLM
jgi:hypothetical protein